MAIATDIMELKCGPLSDNGATPWFVELQVGSSQQKLKFAIDTGTTHSWITSIGCTTDACLNHQRFDFRHSTTFKHVNNPYERSEISFGPWGTLQVSMGADTISFNTPKENEYIFESYQLYIGWDYTGQQFLDLIWDGAIGVPTTIQPKNNDSSELISLLLDLKPWNNKNSALRFNYDKKRLQILDMAIKEAPGKMFTAPLIDSEVLPGAWVINLKSVEVGGQPVIQGKTFCLDTGSSRFKGDPEIINQLIHAVTRGGHLPTYLAQKDPNFAIYPTLKLIFHGESFLVKPQHYFEKLSEDYYKLAFHPMKGLKDMLLAGSTFLESYSPIFFFDENKVGQGIGLLRDDHKKRVHRN